MQRCGSKYPTPCRRFRGSRPASRECVATTTSRRRLATRRRRWWRLREKTADPDSSRPLEESCQEEIQQRRDQINGREREVRELQRVNTMAGTKEVAHDPDIGGPQP